MTPDTPRKRAGRPRKTIPLVLFGQRLRDAIARSPYPSRIAFVQACGVNPATLWKWETGTHKPPGDFVTQAATMLGVTTDYLLGQDANIHPELQLFLDENRDTSEREAAMLATLQLPHGDEPSQGFYLSVLNAYRAQVKRGR